MHNLFYNGKQQDKYANVLGFIITTQFSILNGNRLEHNLRESVTIFFSVDYKNVEIREREIIRIF